MLHGRAAREWFLICPRTARVEAHPAVERVESEKTEGAEPVCREDPRSTMSRQESRVRGRNAMGMSHDLRLSRQGGRDCEA